MEQPESVWTQVPCDQDGAKKADNLAHDDASEANTRPSGNGAGRSYSRFLFGGGQRRVLACRYLDVYSQWFLPCSVCNVWS